MRIKTFFEKFELFADAPNAVEKMRELVLHLAFAGGLLKGATSWPVMPLKSLSTKIGSGATPLGGRQSYVNRGIPLIRSMNVHFDGFKDEGLVYLTDAQAGELANATVQPSDVLLNITGASIGRVTTAPFAMANARVNQHVTIIRPTPNLDSRFLALFLASPGVQRMINDIQVGATRQALTKGKIERFQIPLPPLAEQKRIVAKVEELMVLCDALEARQQERQTRHAALAHASLARFADAPGPANLNFLFHKSYDTTPGELRRSILALGVQGKLVRQQPSDESAEQLVARIAASKAQRVEAKQIKPERPIEAISEDEVLYSIPPTWRWMRAGELCLPISSGSTPDASVFNAMEGVPYLKVYNIRNQAVDFDYKRQFIDRIHHQQRMKRSRLYPGDVIMNIVGPPLGKVAIVPNGYPEWNCNQAIAFFRPVFPELAPYIYMFLKEGSFLSQIELIGTAGQDNISVTKCKFIPIPLPPLAEQRRIVARVDQLMALVDELEAQLAAERSAATALMDTIVAELTAPTAVTTVLCPA